MYSVLCCVTPVGGGWHMDQLTVEGQHDVQSSGELPQAGALHELLQRTQQLVRLRLVLHTENDTVVKMLTMTTFATLSHRKRHSDFKICETLNEGQGQYN